VKDLNESGRPEEMRRNYIRIKQIKTLKLWKTKLKGSDKEPVMEVNSEF